MKRILSLLLYLIIVCQAKSEFPIIAYWGVPDWATSPYHFQMLNKCGFTVSLYPYASLDKLVQACRVANKYGVKIIGNCPEMESTPIKVAQTLKDEAGFYGYFIQDEPSMPEIQLRQRLVDQLQSIDSTHRFYINLLPYSDPLKSLSSAKAQSYPEYIKAAVNTSCQQISFDYYPITTEVLRKTWYQNIEMVRHESLISGKPFWGFVLSVPHRVPQTRNAFYPMPTLASLRLQIYSNLAYGAQAIQYFTYWTPNPNDKLGFHDAPINFEGKKTETYGIVQKMNHELHSIAPLFYGAKVLSVGHLGVVPEGTSRQTDMPINIASLKIKASAGALISTFEKQKHIYMAIVNKDYQHEMKIYIKAQNNIPYHLTKKMQKQPMKTSYTIAAGDILLFRLN